MTDVDSRTYAFYHTLILETPNTLRELNAGCFDDAAQHVPVFGSLWRQGSHMTEGAQEGGVCIVQAKLSYDDGDLGQYPRFDLRFDKRVTAT